MGAAAKPESIHREQQGRIVGLRVKAAACFRAGTAGSRRGAAAATGSRAYENESLSQTVWTLGIVQAPGPVRGCWIPPKYSCLQTPAQGAKGRQLQAWAASTQSILDG